MPSDPDRPRDLGRVEALVLGAGPAGLGAAWELARGGARVLVVERDDGVGGLCRTHERAGFRFDQGGHRFITADRDLLDRVVAVAGDDLLLAERTSEVALLGRRFRYPLEPLDLARNLPPGLAARALGSWLAARVRARLGDRGRPGTEGPADASFEAWATRRFGRALYDLFLGPYTAKVWGVDPAALSAEWASQRISAPDLPAVLRALWARARGGPAAEAPRTFARTYLYPRLGMGQLFERIRADAEAHGARVLLGTTPVRLERRGDRVATLHLAGPDGPAVVRPDLVLSTVPLPRLLGLLDGPAAEDAARARFPFRPVRFLDVALDRTRALPTTWCYVGEGGLRAGRLQEPRRRSPGMCPPGTTSLMVEVPHAPGDDVDRADDAALLARVRDEVRALGVDLDRDVRFAFSTRAPEAYPVHLRGVEAARAQALARVDALANLRTFGRQGAFRFVFSDAALRMGLDAAAGWLAGRLPASVDLARVQSAPALVEVASVVGG